MNLFIYLFIQIMHETNRLLLLWQAAITLEGSELDKKIMDARTKRLQSLKLMKNVCDKLNPNTSGLVKNSHNEVERSRRAYLRSCMEALKKKLVFNSDCQLNRITMLHVLRKATTTIKGKEKSISNLYKNECIMKSQNAQLKQRLLLLEKQQYILSNQYSINLEKRIRNFSECSVNTTSSEESQIDDRFNLRPLQMKKINVDSTQLKESSILVSKCNSPNSNSSDSGFDDLLQSVYHKCPKQISSKMLKKF